MDSLILGSMLVACIAMAMRHWKSENETIKELRK